MTKLSLVVCTYNPTTRETETRWNRSAIHNLNNNNELWKQIIRISDMCLYFFHFISINYFPSLKFYVIVWFCFSSKWIYFVRFCTWHRIRSQSYAKFYINVHGAYFSFILLWLLSNVFFDKFIPVSNAFQLLLTHLSPLLFWPSSIPSSSPKNPSHSHVFLFCWMYYKLLSISILDVHS